MKTTIFYFSGVGNSLKAAKDLAEKLGDTEVISVSKFMGEDGEVSISGDRVGIVYPVYIWGVPRIVSRFIKKIPRKCKDKYFFAVANNHSELAGSLLQLASKLKSRGIKLSAGFSVNMPNSYTVFQKKNTNEYSTRELKKMFDALNERLDEIALLVKDEKKCEIEKGTLAQRIINTGLVNHIAFAAFPLLDIPFKVDHKCVSCGLCEKICPVNNISLKNGKPTWHHKCEQCFRCINCCPKESIQYLNATSGKVRYKNPYVNMKEVDEGFER